MRLESGRYRKLAEDRLELLHHFKQTNDTVHERMLALEEKIRSLSRNQGHNKEQADNLKKLLRDVEELDEILYNDIKKTRISEPVQHIHHGGELTSKLQDIKVR